jgi:hypothetical protein
MSRTLGIERRLLSKAPKYASLAGLNRFPERIQIDLSSNADMQLGEIYYGTADIGRFIYYKLTLSIGNRVEIGLTMTQSNQSIASIPSPFSDISSEVYNLFVGFGYLPDLTVYDYVARQAFTPPHELVSTIINNPLPGDIYIGIYSTVNFEYELAAHSSCTSPTFWLFHQTFFHWFFLILQISLAFDLAHLGVLFLLPLLQTFVRTTATATGSAPVTAPAFVHYFISERTVLSLSWALCRFQVMRCLYTTPFLDSTGATSTYHSRSRRISYF